MKILILIVFVFPLQLLAQDIAGIWTGYLKTTDNTLPFELAISAEGKENFGGYSHTVFTFNGVDNIGVKKIKLKNKKGKVSLEDGELVYSNYTTPPKRIKLYGDLFLKSSDSFLVLSGSFYTRAIDFRAEPTSFVGTVYLRKQKGFPPTKLIVKLDEMELLYTLSFAPAQYKKKEEPVIVAVKPGVIQKENEVKNVSEPVETKTTIVAPNTVAVTEATTKETSFSGTETKRKNKEKDKEKERIAKKDLKKEVELSKQKAIKPEEKQKTAVSTIGSAIKKETPVPVNAAVALAQRKTEIIRSVFFNADSLVLSLYDNGTVDGDTVSVVLNGEVIIARKGLSESAIRTTIHIPPGQGDSLQLVMYAENLGSIPPNTGVLVIQDGSTRNEIRFAGDMQKSSAVILKRRR